MTIKILITDPIAKLRITSYERYCIIYYIWICKRILHHLCLWYNAVKFDLLDAR